MISRRSLFALFGGAVAAPLAKASAPEFYDGHDVVADHEYKPVSMTVVVGHAYGSGGPGGLLVCENHRTMIWPDECDCGPGMLLKDV